MGMYSWTDWCDLTLREGVSIEEAKKVFDEIEQEYTYDEEEVSLFDIYTHKAEDGTEIHRVEITLPGSGWKIISYWYDHTLDMLKKLATVLEGTWALCFETRDEAADISFNDGVVSIETGCMKWTTHSLDDLRTD